VRGDLVVEPLTDDPDAVFSPGRRLLAGTATGEPARDTAELHIDSAYPFKGGFIVHFAEIGDRSVAETWLKRFLLAPADELSELADGEVYEYPGGYSDWAAAKARAAARREAAAQPAVAATQPPGPPAAKKRPASRAFRPPDRAF